MRFDAASSYFVCHGEYDLELQVELLSHRFVLFVSHVHCLSTSQTKGIIVMENSVANRRHTKKQLAVAVAAIFTIAFVGLQAWLLDGSHATAPCNTIPTAMDELNDPYENRYTAHIGSGSVVQMTSTPRQRAVVHMGIHKVRVS